MGHVSGRQAAVHLPVEQHLIDRYPAEYARYLRQAEDAAAVSASTAASPDADRRPTHPAAFDIYAAVLAQYDWDVRWIFGGHRVWLDAWPKAEQITAETPARRPAWRDGGRLIAIAVRNRTSAPEVIGNTTAAWSAFRSSRTRAMST
ncbi:hypothetical protein [Actinoallomurus sp. CA-150999]|uniref:hypothetical protein n=1 Tax=Actinoallomurus sp. CA-150999 TaxID=3239887 RepID=UPI003D94B8ED